MDQDLAWAAGSPAMASPGINFVANPSASSPSAELSAKLYFPIPKRGNPGMSADKEILISILEDILGGKSLPPPPQVGAVPLPERLLPPDGLKKREDATASVPRQPPALDQAGNLTFP